MDQTKNTYFFFKSNINQILKVKLNIKSNINQIAIFFCNVKSNITQISSSIFSFKSNYSQISLPCFMFKSNTLGFRSNKSNQISRQTICPPLALEHILSLEIVQEMFFLFNPNWKLVYDFIQELGLTRNIWDINLNPPNRTLKFNHHFREAFQKKTIECVSMIIPPSDPLPPPQWVNLVREAWLGSFW